MRTSNMKRILALTCSLVDPMFEAMDELGDVGTISSVGLGY